MAKTKRHWRQGDVLVIATTKTKAGAAVPRDERGRAVLAAGELTGHHHAIASVDALLSEIATPKPAQTGERFLRTTAPVDLSHEEHSTIRLPKGSYVVRIQREYDPIETRRVED